MKILKYLFFLILLIFIGVAIYFGTQPSQFKVSETRVIDAPQEMIYSEVMDFKNWEQWGSWMQDTTIVFQYPEVTSGVGASYSWTSKDGDGAIQTLSANPPDSIKQKIVFGESLEKDGYTLTWHFEPVNDSTRVTWTMEGRMGLFDKIYFAFQDEPLEASVSKMYTNSLKNLDSVLQKKLDEHTIVVNGVTQYSGGFYLFNSTAAKQQEIMAKVPQLIRQVEDYMKANNISVDGKPFVEYLEWDETNKNAVFSVGIPTKDRVILPNGVPVISGFKPSFTAVKTTLTGKHAYLSKAWRAAEKYIEDNGYIRDATINPIEVFTLRYPQEKNPAKWITEIYLPVLEIPEGQVPESLEIIELPNRE